MSRRGNETVFHPHANGFSYTPDGKIKHLRLGNGLWESALFNNRLQVTELNLGHSVVNNPGDAGGHLWKLGYEYGELDENGEVIPSTNTGNIGKQTLSVPGVTFIQRYRYDSLYRLTSAVETPGENETWRHTFEYDRYGNRTGFQEQINRNETPRTAPEVNPETNRFINGQGFVYDKNGNVVQDVDGVTNQSRTFIFNGDNKQAEIRDANGHLIGKYFYDGEGKRVKKFIFATNETTVFVYSSGKLVAECSDGLGRDDFLKWFDADNSASLADRLCEKYQVNGQTAWSLLRKAERFDIMIVASLDTSDIKKMRLKRTDLAALASLIAETKQSGYIFPNGARFLVSC